ncbi:MAG: hypothetical protein AB2A00_35565 [Myxococcota bacterium]
MRTWLAALLLLLTLPARAQTPEEADAASAALSAQLSAGLRVTWTGQGLSCGPILLTGLSNGSGAPLTVRLVPGMVLTPSDDGQRMMLASRHEVALQAGQEASVMPEGYCLDPSKDPPPRGQAVNYSLGSGFAADLTLIRVGERLAAEGRFGPEFPPDQRKVVVIQRAIWASRGYTRQDLAVEIADEFAARTDPNRAGSVSPEALADSIWRDVELVLREAGQR